jgi:hypothetical protein
MPTRIPLRFSVTNRVGSLLLADLVTLLLVTTFGNELSGKRLAVIGER